MSVSVSISVGVGVSLGVSVSVRVGYQLRLRGCCFQTLSSLTCMLPVYVHVTGAWRVPAVHMGAGVCVRSIRLCCGVWVSDPPLPPPPSLLAAAWLLGNHRPAHS